MLQLRTARANGYGKMIGRNTEQLKSDKCLSAQKGRGTARPSPTMRHKGEAEMLIVADAR